jgi:hypothetical protein
MELLQEAIRNNQQGLHLLRERKVTNALTAFETSLMILREAVKGKSEWTNQQIPCAGCQDCPHELLQLDNCVGLQSDVCYIFDRPLLVPLHPMIRTSEEFDQFVRWASSAILFNYALTCHWYATLSGRDICFAKALHLYNLALKMVQSVARDGARPTAYALVECATLNNLAHIHYQQCAFQHSTHCIGILRERLMEATGLSEYLSAVEVLKSFGTDASWSLPKWPKRRDRGSGCMKEHFGMSART